jgi:uncharacterized membrane protein HdeD (DUF308 family)
MGKLSLIILGIILLILGILAIIPAMNFAAMWLAVVLAVLGILGIILGFLAKKQAA